jgi:hypothetical protein
VLDVYLWGRQLLMRRVCQLHPQDVIQRSAHGEVGGTGEQGSEAGSDVRVLIVSGTTGQAVTAQRAAAPRLAGGIVGCSDGRRSGSGCKRAGKRAAKQRAEHRQQDLHRSL